MAYYGEPPEVAYYGEPRRSLITATDMATAPPRLLATAITRSRRTTVTTANSRRWANTSRPSVTTPKNSPWADTPRRRRWWATRYEPLSESPESTGYYAEPEISGYVRETAEQPFNPGCPMPTNVAGFDEAEPTPKPSRSRPINVHAR